MRKRIFIVGILFVILIVLHNFYSISTIKEKVGQPPTESVAESKSEEKGEDIELGDVMTKLQRHANKLWFSGKAANWPLAAFYVHELDETFEELTIHEVFYEGVNISLLTKQMGLKPLKSVEDAVKRKDGAAFRSSYKNLVSSCNTCHQSSNHPFVVIKTPTVPAFDNQEYEVQLD
ncbi:MAG: hypothetical protein JKY52_12775 [Flavobacteriales bacterium]|nr:hypothetical protein [Flavobacteriales bacterium]